MADVGSLTWGGSPLSEVRTGLCQSSDWCVDIRRARARILFKLINTKITKSNQAVAVLENPDPSFVFVY